MELQNQPPSTDITSLPGWGWKPRQDLTVNAEYVRKLLEKKGTGQVLNFSGSGLAIPKFVTRLRIE